MIEILLVIAWVGITFFIFSATKKNNKIIKYKIYKATWEPCAVSFFIAILLSMYWFAQQL